MLLFSGGWLAPGMASGSVVCLSHYAEEVSWPLWKVRSKVSLLTDVGAPKDRKGVGSGNLDQSFQFSLVQLTGCLGRRVREGVSALAPH